MPVTLAGTTSIVASIPALIGFVPHDSLVLFTALTRDDGSVTAGPLTRIDLAHLTRHAGDCVRQFNRQVADLPVLCVTGIVVHAVNEDDTADAVPLREDVDAVVALLAEFGFTDVEVVHVPAIAEGARWRSYRDSERTGVLPDPATTAAAVAATVAGQPVAACREDLAARFTPAAEQVRERLRQDIAHAVELAVIDQHSHLAAHVRLGRADAAIRAASDGDLPADDAAIVDLVATFATLPFRDALLAVPDDARRLGAENLLLQLWRHSCGPVAGQLATVIAMHAYLRGDGTGAGIALENADPEQPLTRLLTSMLGHAVPPSKVRDLVQKASAEARRALLGEPPADHV
ncbi:DUF4192 domain-containing protein [Amycolatopsis sp. NBC_00355]|uniref:DUF4192 domain-containing protein n=1 Tax=Amycolatopsis sp. NBC_00355 TaxID=2975957 RepID=UPI002E2749C5